MMNEQDWPWGIRGQGEKDQYHAFVREVEGVINFSMTGSREFTVPLLGSLIKVGKISSCNVQSGG